MESKTTGTGNKTAADIAALLRARNPLLVIVSREEARVERFCFKAAETAGYDFRRWDCASGISDYAGNPKGDGKNATDPAAVIGAIRDSNERAVWVLCDLIPAWTRDANILRGLRTLARKLPLAPRDQARAVIVITPTNEIPPELQGHVVVIDFPLPDRSEIAELVQTALDSLPDDIKERAADAAIKEAAIDAAVGLTEEEAGACYRKSLVMSRKIEPATVAAEKKRVIAREKVLEWYDPLPGGLDSVGGNGHLKEWLIVRKAAFTAAARAYGLPEPRGVLFVGVPGCGKSLTAKALGTAWGKPVLRLDMGALKSKWVGESEANIRKALKVAVAVGGILWIDEIEKGLSGATQGAADGGVSGDALGVLLTALQEMPGLFVVATANSVTSLPPELLRKGRFDEIFFVDLPTQGERVEILRAALRLYGRENIALDFAAVAHAAREFTGAEIAALVPDAMYTAFGDNAREITTADLIRAASTVVPLSKTAAEKIATLREWAATRARRASAPEAATAAPAARSIDL